MPRYDRVYVTLVERAIAQGGVDVETFMRQALEAGMTERRLQTLLEQDLNEGGPIFGKFLRSLGGAAVSSVMSAHRQGTVVGAVLADDELNAFLDLAGESGTLEDAVAYSDPEAAERVEVTVGPRLVETWICTLVNTCHLCLPNHGRTMSHDEWVETGLTPDTIHLHQGWESSCRCVLIPSHIATDQEDLLEPLRREKFKSPTGVKGSKRTRRRIIQKDFDRAVAARDQALETKAGRRTMRIMGQANKETQNG